MYKKISFPLIITFLLSACGNNSNSTPTDTTPPAITINGDVNTIINLNEEYIELGANVSDDIDPNPTLEISGTVDNTTPNNYTITYVATDAAGNYSTEHRYVTVSPSELGEDTNIDVLVAYTPNSLDIDIINGDFETYVNHLFTTSNLMFSNSLTFTKLNIIHITESNIDDKIPSSEALTLLRTDESIKSIRDTYNADEVVLFRPYVNDGICGIAFLNTLLYEQLAYAHVSIECPTTTLAHEIGHNMGLDHGYMGNNDEPDLNGRDIYSIGHLIQDSFGTIMSYARVYNTIQEPLFSNPYLECGEGFPCGILPGEEKAAYSVRTILETSKEISRFR